MPVLHGHAADVAVHLAGRQQLGKRGLVEHATGEVGGVLRVPVRRHQVFGDDEPSEPHARGERLGDAAPVEDDVGSEAWRADRRAVVAELRVVVVLEDEPAARPRPLEQRGGGRAR